MYTSNTADCRGPVLPVPINIVLGSIILYQWCSLELGPWELWEFGGTVQVFISYVQAQVLYILYQSLSFEVDHREMQDLRRRTEKIPVKDSHTRIKPLALASGHGRYITVTPERTLVSVGECPLHIAVINL
jgi:hypothetical protein